MESVASHPVEEYDAFGTCTHNGRVFHFSLLNESLFMTEFDLTAAAPIKTVKTDITSRAGGKPFVSCCSIGDGILVLFGGERRPSLRQIYNRMSKRWGALRAAGLCVLISLLVLDIFIVDVLSGLRIVLHLWRAFARVSAILVSIDDGPLRKSSVRFTKLAIPWHVRLPSLPFLSQTSEERVLLHFHKRTTMYRCRIFCKWLAARKIRGTGLLTEELVTEIRLPSGKFLAVKPAPGSAEVRLVFQEFSQRESIANLFGRSRRPPTAVLVAERFLVGFGGYWDDYIDNLWILDLQAHQSSLIREYNEWERSAPFLALGSDRILLLWKPLRVLQFRVLADLIEDDIVRNAFCDTLRLSRSSRYVLPQLRSGITQQDSRCRGQLFLLWSHVFLHNGKFFSVTSDSGELFVHEVFVSGRTTDAKSVGTGVKVNAYSIQGCSLRDKVLVVGGSFSITFAALISVDGENLSTDTVHTTVLAVISSANWFGAAHLCPISKNSVLLCDRYTPTVCYCIITERVLYARSLISDFAPCWSFRTLPACLHEKEAVIVTSQHKLTELLTLRPTVSSKPRSRWTICDEWSDLRSIFVVKRRFVLGLEKSEKSPNGLGCIWVFDLGLNRISRVTNTLGWYPEWEMPILLVQNNTLYIIDKVICTVSIESFAQLIQDEEIRNNFLSNVEGRFVPSECFRRQQFRHKGPFHL